MLSFGRKDGRMRGTAYVEAFTILSGLVNSCDERDGNVGFIRGQVHYLVLLAQSSKCKYGPFRFEQSQKNSGFTNHTSHTPYVQA